MTAGAEARPVRVVAGRAIVMRGDDIDTDRIMPARFLRAITFEGLEQHLFEDERAAQGAAHPFGNPANSGASVLFVNRNFGCGSSREHAPQALARWGIRAIVGESFGEIFLGNAVGIGVACATAARHDIAQLMALIESAPATPVTVDLESLSVIAGAQSVSVHLGEAYRQALLTGAWDSTGLLLERYAEVQAAADRVPYIKGFDIPESSGLDGGR
jgi:3-isopropylmalate/(R)-2-methylmalate dehydratase small subunit